MMEKTLENLLVEARERKLSLRKKRGNKAIFLRLWPEIREMLNRGWSLTTISIVLRKNSLLVVHYETLRRYVVQQQASESGIVE